MWHTFGNGEKGDMHTQPLAQLFCKAAIHHEAKRHMADFVRRKHRCREHLIHTRARRDELRTGFTALHSEFQRRHEFGIDFC